MVARRSTLVALLLSAALGLTACGGGGADAATGGVALAAPTQAPTSVVASPLERSVRVTWNAVPGSSLYALYMASSPGVGPESWRSLPEGRAVMGLTGTDAVVSGLNAGHSYWCVVAARSEGGEGPVSLEAFTTLAPAGVTVVAARAANASAVLEWNGVVGAAFYDVYTAPDPTISSANWAALPGAQRFQGVYPPFSIPGLVNGVPCYAVVVARNDAGRGADSPPGFCTPSGRGTFLPLPEGTVNAGTGAQGTLLVDLNDDDVLDLVVTNHDDGTLSVFLGKGDGCFDSPSTHTVGAGPVAVAVGNFDNQGGLDLATADEDAHTVSVLLSDGWGGYLDASTYPVGLSPIGILAVTLNPAGGTTDLVVANQGDATVSVLSGWGDGGFSDALHYVTGGGPMHLVDGDFNGDGLTDVLTADGWDGTVSCLLGDGLGGLLARVVSATGPTPAGVTVADYDGDLILDLTVADTSTNCLVPLHGTGTGAFVMGTPLATGAAPLDTVMGDFNGDGQQDVAVTNANGGGISVFLGDGAGGFESNGGQTTGGTPGTIAMGDFDGDGILDLAIVDHATGKVLILTGSPV